MRTSFLSVSILALTMALGCGSTAYRVVSSDHDISLGSTLALSAVAHAAPAHGVDRDHFDARFAQAVEEATPDHRVAHGIDAPYMVFVHVRELRREGVRTVADAGVAIRDADGQTVDELEVTFEVDADEGEAGAELGRRIGFFLTHREGHQI